MTTPPINPVKPSQPPQRSVLGSLIRNSVVGIVMAILGWLPLAIRLPCCTTVNEWATQLLIVLGAGASVGIIGTAAPSIREALGGAVVGLLLSLTLYLIHPPNIWGRLELSLFARLCIVFATVVAGAIGGVVATLPNSEAKSPLIEIVFTFGLSALGSVAGGGIASFISVGSLIFGPFVTGISTTLSILDLPRLAYGFVLYGVFFSTFGVMLGSLVGGVFGLLGAGVGRLGDRSIGIAMGAAVGVAISTVVSISTAAIFSMIR